MSVTAQIPAVPLFGYLYKIKGSFDELFSSSLKLRNCSKVNPHFS